MDKTNVKIEYIIIGDEFNANDVTEKLKIIPCQYWIKGEDIEGRRNKRKDTC